MEAPPDSNQNEDALAVVAVKRDRRAGNIVTDSAAALLSSSLFSTMFYPLHRIKILLQTQDSNPLITSGQVRRYTIVDSVPRLLREGGVRELWRGNGAYMLRHVPSTTLSFAFKDALLRHVLPHIDLAPPPPPPPQPSPPDAAVAGGGRGASGAAAGPGPGSIAGAPGWSRVDRERLEAERVARDREGMKRFAAATAVNLAAGFLGGAAALLLVYPLDFATIRMASELRKQKKSIGMLETLKSTQRAGGLRALYRGYGVSALAIGAYKSLYFGLYDTAVAAMEQRNARRAAAAAAAATGGTAQSPRLAPHHLVPQHLHSHAAHAAAPSHALHAHAAHHGPTVLERWAAANVVVLAASSITYPLDVVRKRLVADTAMGPGRQQFRGFMDCVTKIVRTEGLPGFYRFYGYDMLLRLGGGVLLVLYDELKAHGAGRMRQQVMQLAARGGEGGGGSGGGSGGGGGGRQ
ncbi:hypothetical protein CHLRE_06g307300v5 [Chlamydomonas reinhardtii]|uniref:ADP/ATP translocase n=1 Tax=Chlamydomonas reinhardtii TaxID=3055 RepID=A0A2K3DRI1_CHLRE|nr:uncharacterized protein CHLRE_06g307300v5 [Chlamydomonas reinhardtii]PNW83117.1 hypothetical protein CHLRE_06g307300v5 [Chlamydomonas reinhardtii]